MNALEQFLVALITIGFVGAIVAALLFGLSALIEETRHSNSRWRGAWGGVVAGIVAGAVLSVLMVVMNLVEGKDIWMGMKFAGAPFLGEVAMEPGFDAAPVAIGLLSHFAVSIGWGLLFGLLAYGLSRPLTVAAGALYGIVVWAGMYYVVLPIVGMGYVAGMVPVPVAVLEHMLFGLLVGLAFLPFQRRRPHTWHHGALPAH